MSIRTKALNCLMDYDFFNLAKHTSHPRTRIRLLGLGHLQKGEQRQIVAKMFNVTERTVGNWINKFLKEGIEGIQEGYRSGRKKYLEEINEEEFRLEVESLQEEREGGRIRGKDIQVMLKEKFSVDYALPSVYHVLERCDLSWISARSKHSKADFSLQEEFRRDLKKK